MAFSDKRKPIRGLEELLTVRHIRERLGLAYGAVSLRSYGCVYVEATEDYYVDEFREEDVGLFRQILVQAKETISTWDGRLYFVYLPDWLRYSKPKMANRDRERVLTLVRTVGIPIIDIHQVFQAQSDPLALFPLRLTGHYSVEGHQVVAEAVLQSISLDKR